MHRRAPGRGRWWARLLRRPVPCVCGLRWPCPDAGQPFGEQPPPPRPARLGVDNRPAAWDLPTAFLPAVRRSPLLTRGQRARGAR